MRSRWVRVIAATSRSFRPRPSRAATVTSPMSCTEAKRLSVRTTYSALRSRSRPPEALTFSWASASATAPMGTPRADRRSSSTSTRISSSSPPETLAAATPCSDSISRLSTSSATARRRAREASPHSPMRSTGSWAGSYFSSTGGSASAGNWMRSTFSRTSSEA
ncbi:MAG: hypothetical protein IPI34_13025 [bacterium]|nr:hypothetical protein [bacterium]